MTHYATVTCVDCGQSRSILRNSKELPKRCRDCAQKRRSNSRRQYVAARPPEGGFGDLKAGRIGDLACRYYSDVIGHYEVALERVYSASTVPLEARQDAAEICRDCPLVKPCAKAAKVEHYTGLAGGTVWRHGEEQVAA